MSEEKDIQLIEDYWLDNLDSSERDDVGIRSRADEKFRNKLNDFGLLMAGIKYSGRKHLIDHLKVVDDQMPEMGKTEGKVRPLFVKRVWYAAAAVVLIVASTFLFQKMGTDYTEIASEYFEAYPNISKYNTQRSSNNSPETTKALAFSYYDQKLYHKAIETFGQLSTNELDELSRFYRAHAHQNAGEYLQAINYYKEEISAKNRLSAQIHWYLALCYLQKGSPHEARSVLQKIIEMDDRGYQEKAKNLLIKL